MADIVQDLGTTIQSGLKVNSKEYNKFSYFLSGVDVTSQNLAEFNPYIQGVSRIYMYRTPVFMDKQFANRTKNFKSYIETGYTRIDGISDISVDFIDFEGGFAGQKFSNVSLARDDTDTLTISVYEQSGSPVREYIDTWITGVRDVRSGIAHYHGAVEDGTVAYGEINHTAEFVYYTSDPTGKNLEYGCMFAHAFPTKVPKSHLNYEKGERGNVLLDLEFKVQKYESTYINAVCMYYANRDKIKYRYTDFNPNITDGDVGASFNLGGLNG